MSTFIDDCLNSLIFKDIEASKFLVKQFKESIELKLDSTELGPNINQTRRFSALASNRSASINENTTYFIDKETCFNNLIQFDIKTYEPEFEVTKFKKTSNY